MKINKQVETKRIKHETLGELVTLTFKNKDDNSSMFKVDSSTETNLEDYIDGISARLTLDTAKKLGQALITLSKGKG